MGYWKENQRSQHYYSILGIELALREAVREKQLFYSATNVSKRGTSVILPFCIRFYKNFAIIFFDI